MELVFKEPVTLKMLEEACSVLDLAIDDVLDRPQEALADKGVPLSQLKTFLEIVLEDVPDLDGMPVEEAEAIGTYAAADFFLSVLLRRLNEPMLALSRSGGGAAFRTVGAR